MTDLVRVSPPNHIIAMEKETENRLDQNVENVDEGEVLETKYARKCPFRRPKRHETEPVPRSRSICRVQGFLEGHALLHDIELGRPQ